MFKWKTYPLRKSEIKILQVLSSCSVDLLFSQVSWVGSGWTVYHSLNICGCSLVMSLADMIPESIIFHVKVVSKQGLLLSLPLSSLSLEWFLYSRDSLYHRTWGIEFVMFFALGARLSTAHLVSLVFWDRFSAGWLLRWPFVAAVPKPLSGSCSWLIWVASWTRCPTCWISVSAMDLLWLWPDALSFPILD